MNAVAWDVVDCEYVARCHWRAACKSSLGGLIVDAGRGRRMGSSGETRRASKQPSKQMLITGLRVAGDVYRGGGGG